MFLGSSVIKKLILEKGMIKGYGNLEEQLQPDGFDLRVDKVMKTDGVGFIGVNTKALPLLKDIEFTNVVGGWILCKGSYIISFMEEVNLPKDIAAITIQRSTVMRCNDATVVGSWDAGYNGKGYNKLSIDNNDGLILEHGSRVVQMHFIPVAGENFSYNGSYQGENLDGSC